MAYYVEYLRAVRALRVVAVVLGLLLVGALILRFSWHPWGPEDYVSSIEHSPTAHVTRTVLPNGVTRTVIDDPKRGGHTVVERRAGSITSVGATSSDSPPDRARNREGVRAAGARPPTHRQVVNLSAVNSFFGVGSLFSMTIPLGLLAATLLAGPLSKENNGHLELAWTKPVSRERYALSAVFVDVTAIALAQVATLVAIVLGALFWEVPRLSFESSAPAEIAFAVLVPMAWYACLTAFSASFKRGPGAVLGIGWVAAAVCPAIAAATQHSSTAVGHAVSMMFNAISWLDPVAYSWFGMTKAGADGGGWAIPMSALAELVIGYIGLALLQWRRVEA
jgi:hypothetical protein